jgi:glutamine synthetase
MVRDPFRKFNHVMVLCETFLPDRKTPAKANFRNICDKIMKEASPSDPWFGIE